MAPGSAGARGRCEPRTGRGRRGRSAPAPVVPLGLLHVDRAGHRRAVVVDHRQDGDEGELAVGQGEDRGELAGAVVLDQQRAHRQPQPLHRGGHEPIGEQRQIPRGLGLHPADRALQLVVRHHPGGEPEERDRQDADRQEDEADLQPEPHPLSARPLSRVDAPLAPRRASGLARVGEYGFRSLPPPRASSSRFSAGSAASQGNNWTCLLDPPRRGRVRVSCCPLTRLRREPDTVRCPRRNT